MKKRFELKKGWIALLILLSSCGFKGGSSEPVLISLQLKDRNGVQETISEPHRLEKYTHVNFLDPQPYEKVTCHFKQKGFTSSKVLSYHKNGQLMQSLDVVSARAKGAYREFFENGNIKLEAEVVEGIGDLSFAAQESWIFDGHSKVFYENGTLKALIPYKKGILEGLSIFYKEDGSVWKQTPFVAGQVHGKELFFGTDQEILGSVNYEKGLRDGPAWISARQNGLNVHEKYEKGKLIEGEYRDAAGVLLSQVVQGEGVCTFFEKGALYRTEEIAGGIVEGKISFYRPNGGLDHTFVQKNGMKEGEEWFYHANSKPKLKVIWENDQIHGVVQSWYDDGVIESERMYASNKKEGAAFAWYKEGSRMLIEEYENDILIFGRYFKKGDSEPVSRVKEGEGTATLFDAKGNFLNKVTYKKGLPVHG